MPPPQYPLRELTALNGALDAVGELNPPADVQVRIVPGPDPLLPKADLAVC